MEKYSQDHETILFSPFLLSSSLLQPSCLSGSWNVVRETVLAAVNNFDRTRQNPCKNLAITTMKIFNPFPHIDTFWRICKHSRPRSDSSYRSFLIRVYYVCLLKMKALNIALLVLAIKVLVLCALIKKYSIKYSYWAESRINVHDCLLQYNCMGILQIAITEALCNTWQIPILACQFGFNYNIESCQ